MTTVFTDPVEARLRALVVEIQRTAGRDHHHHQAVFRHRQGMHKAAMMLRAELDGMYGSPKDRRQAMLDAGCPRGDAGRIRRLRLAFPGTRKARKTGPVASSPHPV